MSLEQTEPLVTFTHTDSELWALIWDRLGAQMTSPDRDSGLRSWLQWWLAGDGLQSAPWVIDVCQGWSEPSVCGHWPAALLPTRCRRSIKLGPKNVSQRQFFTAVIKQIPITHGYFGPNYVLRAIMTQEENYARTAANSFTIISAQTCGFSSCLFTGRTSTYGNERVWYYFLVAHNVAISLRWLPASLSVGDRHKPFHRMLIWRAISLQVGVVARALTSSHCCISISH